MIYKHFQLQKIKLNNYNLYLLYGKNEGLQKEVIEKNFTDNFEGEICKYDEKDVLNDGGRIIEEILNISLFTSKKIILINRASDKLIKFVEEILEKNLNDTKVIIKAGVLEKKSKLRNLFEKGKNLITIPFYQDELRDLLPILKLYMDKHRIKLSRESINLILDRANGSREILNNELEKIHCYSISNKSIDFNVVKKLTNLGENFEVNDLADQYLCKNRKNISKILNENNYNDEDCMLILRTILNKSKRLLSIIKVNEEINDVDKVIMQTKPPIFWKDKENVKKQVKSWAVEDLKNNIYKINEVETLIKSNSKNTFNVVSDFIINC